MYSSLSAESGVLQDRACCLRAALDFAETEQCFIGWQNHYRRLIERASRRCATLESERRKLRDELRTAQQRVAEIERQASLHAAALAQFEASSIAATRAIEDTQRRSLTELGAIRAAVEHRTREHQAALSVSAARIESLGQRVADLDSRFEQLDKRLDDILGTLRALRPLSWWRRLLGKR